MGNSNRGKRHHITSMSKDIETFRASDSARLAPQKTKKTDVAEHPKVFDHVGLLFNEGPGKAGLLLSSRPTTSVYGTAQPRERNTN